MVGLQGVCQLARTVFGGFLGWVCFFVDGVALCLGFLVQGGQLSFL